ncbi:hypothetical protein M8J76_017104 [Diaphorina citri]|nr:hypothetical protein M8J76_017104 [Diaphorina citri]
MLSSTRTLLKAIKYQNLLNINQIILNQVKNRSYCQQITTLNKETSQLKTTQPGTEISSDKSFIEPLDATSNIIDVSTFTLTPEEESKIHQYDRASEKSVLEPSDEDVSHVTPILPATQTFARYANHSTTIQKLADLGVHLYRWEDNDKVMNLIVNLDYETQLKKYIMFFHETVGVPLDDLGPMLSKCPFLLEQKLDTMKARIEYLKGKKFQDSAIAQIIAKHPKWLQYRVEQIDERLGFFQQSFHLTGDEVRALCAQLPKLITRKKTQLLEVSFSVQEEMGFEKKEMKRMLLAHPRLWTQDATEVVKTFNYVHSDMKVPHERILEFPNILTSRRFRIENRHSYLKSLGRDQYDPCKENYVSMKSLVSGTDAEFCANVAKTTPETYNLFLKSL